MQFLPAFEGNPTIKFDKIDTLETLKEVGRVIEYWKEGPKKQRKVLIDWNGRTVKCVGVCGANQFQYKARIEGSSAEVIICVNSNKVFEIASPTPKTIRRRVA